ncbi:MAG: DoxX family membrane protein [Planctomycetota bacterium]|nr:DoxX family membrane protein [Planctomycetota bacterium]
MSRSQMLAPLLLRLALGVTFVWAGMGKLFAEMDVQGERAAMLANWGSLEKAPAKTPPAPEGDAIPGEARPEGRPDAQPDERPVPRDPLPPATQGRVRPAYFADTYDASDFPEPVRTRRVNGLALLVHAAAFPQAREDGSTPMALWPGFAAQGRMPVYVAWGVALTELAGGGMLLIGLLTRLAALGIAGSMLGAMWLTEIGPAIQKGQTVLGFLPDRPGLYTPAMSPDGYVSLLWQAALLAMALAIVLLGPGMLALDHAMRSSPVRPPAPRPAPTHE